MSKANDVKTGEIVEVVGEIKAYDSFRSELAEMQKNNATLVFDYENKKGQKEARSHIHLLRKSRSALETARKAEKQASLAHGKKVDAEAKSIEAVILDMIDVHLVPVEEAEQREEKRMHDIATKIERFAELASPVNCNGTTYTLPELQEGMAALIALEVDDSFGEFIDEAIGAKGRAIDALEALIATSTKAEADAKELEALREEKRLKDEKEQQEREAKEKAERDERIREEARQEEKRKSEEREAELIRQAEQAEKDKKAAKEKAEFDQAEAVRKAEEKVKREAEEAESARLAKAEDERKEAERKAANTRHQKKINNEALASLVECGHTEDVAKALIVHIATGKIKNITINY